MLALRQNCWLFSLMLLLWNQWALSVSVGDVRRCTRPAAILTQKEVRVFSTVALKLYSGDAVVHTKNTMHGPSIVCKSLLRGLGLYNWWAEQWFLRLGVFSSFERASCTKTSRLIEMVSAGSVRPYPMTSVQGSSDVATLQSAHLVIDVLSLRLLHARKERCFRMLKKLFLQKGDLCTILILAI